jgi:hypothetical protein
MVIHPFSLYLHTPRGHGHGHGDGRPRSQSRFKRSEKEWNETKKSVMVTSRDGHGHVPFSIKNERFTVGLHFVPFYENFHDHDELFI